MQQFFQSNFIREEHLFVANNISFMTKIDDSSNTDKDSQPFQTIWCANETTFAVQMVCK